MSKMIKRTFFIFLFAFYFLSIGCNNRDFARISSRQPYFEWKSELDTVSVYRTTLTSNFQETDTLYGSYNYLVLPGFHGHILKLNKDSTFLEYMWTDSPLQPRAVKGRWSIRGDKVVLKKAFRKAYEFIIFRYSWTTFLVPPAKSDQFLMELESNKMRIDSMAPFAKYRSSSELNRDMACFKNICFYRRPDKNQ